MHYLEIFYRTKTVYVKKIHNMKSLSLIENLVANLKSRR